MSVARATAAADDNRSKHQLDATAKSVPCAATTSSNNTRLLDYDRAFAEGLPIATSLIETGAVPDPTSRSGRSSILRCILLNGRWGQFPGASRSSRLTSARRYPDTDDGAMPRRRQRDHAILDLHPIETPAGIVKARIGRTSRWLSTGLQTALTSASFEPPVTLRR